MYNDTLTEDGINDIQFVLSIFVSFIGIFLVFFILKNKYWWNKINNYIKEEEGEYNIKKGRKKR